MPHWLDFIGGLFLWAGTFILASLITKLTLYFFPQNLEVLEELNNVLIGENPMWFIIIIVAILPAVCEEMLFRGYLLSASSDGGNFKRGIIISSIMFGAMHLYAIKLIPTALLGACFAYVAYKSGSILVGMLLHFINNGLAVIVFDYPNSSLALGFQWLEIDFSVAKSGLLIGTAIGILFIGRHMINSASYE